MSNENTFLIYQLKGGGDTRDYRFESFSQLQSKGLSVDKDNYNHIYTAPLADSDTPDSIYVRLNLVHPADFAGHSLSVSDIIVMHRGGETTAHYVEPVGFVQLPEFLEGAYKYFSTQRPIDMGTIPKTENTPVKISNFDNREWVENATFRAWGYVTYDTPLTQEQVNNYELRAASDNPDQVRLSPYQLEAQAQTVGQWEQSKRIPEPKRVTWFHNDYGVYVKKEHATTAHLSKQFGKAVEDKANATVKRAYKKYPELLKEGAEQVQVVGVWEEQNNIPDNQRYTCHKPSIQGFALRVPVISPEKLIQRYQQAKHELSTEKPTPPKSIAVQIAEGAAQAAKDNAARPTPPTHTDIDR